MWTCLEAQKRPDFVMQFFLSGKNQTETCNGPASDMYLIEEPPPHEHLEVTSLNLSLWFYRKSEERDSKNVILIRSLARIKRLLKL